MREEIAPRSIEEELDELAAFAEEAGIEEGDLDDLIIDELQRQASNLNNEGEDVQLRYLASTASEDPDEEVLDSHLQTASDINNQGVRGQLRYLLEKHGAAIVKADLEQLKGIVRMGTPGQRRAMILQDDKDAHEEGCDCGECNSQGKSFGAAIFIIPEGTSPDGLEISHLQPSDPLTRVYAPSPQAAIEAAREECRKQNITVVSAT